MSLLNASQQIQQNSPDSGGQTPPSTAAGSGPPFEQNRNSIHQLLNPNVDATGNAAAPRTAEGSEAVSTPPSSSNYAPPQGRYHPPAGLAPPASTAAGVGHSPNMDSPSFAPERAARPQPADETVEIVKGFRVSFYEADRALNLFRSIYSPYFPFVCIPVMMTSFELYETTPFLFRTVVAVTTSQPPAVQAEYKLWFREFVAKHVVVHNERRLEILQAILLYLAWYVRFPTYAIWI